MKMTHDDLPLFVLDVESFYGTGYTLRGSAGMSYSQYVIDERFKIFGISLIDCDSGEKYWITGTHEEIAEQLAAFELNQAAVISHNSLFDMFVLAHHFNIHPAFYYDTLAMARALEPYEDNSLDALAVRHGGTGKVHGDYLEQLKDVRDPTPEQLQLLGVYAHGDTADTKLVFDAFMRTGFPDDELSLIDITTRMFCAPKLCLDETLAQEELDRLYAKRDALIAKTGYSKKDLGGRKVFPEILRKHGVEPPTVINEKGNKAYAFNKNNPDFQKLLSHPDERVRDIINARLEITGNIHIKRLERLLHTWRIAEVVPVGLKAYGAKTMRWSGTDKTNMQNIPKTRMRECLIAPPGHMLIVGDSSQIEARLNAWNADEQELLHLFATGGDPYCDFASKVYGRPITKAEYVERFVGKTCILGLGYGMGRDRFMYTLATSAANFGIEDYVPITEAEAYHIVQLYRHTYARIKEFWNFCTMMIQNVMPAIVSKNPLFVDSFKPQPVTHKAITFKREAIEMPNGLQLHYPQIRPDGGFCDNRRIYGSHMVENIVQSLARIVVGEQMRRIAKEYQPVMMTHDEIVICVPDHEVECATEIMEHHMRIAPDWCSDIPLDCEVKHDTYYCK